MSFLDTAREIVAGEPLDINLMIGRRVRQRRRMLGLTQHEVAKACGVPHQRVAKYEVAANRIPLEVLIKIAAALECEPGEFVNGIGS